MVPNNFFNILTILSQTIYGFLTVHHCGTPCSIVLYILDFSLCASMLCAVYIESILCASLLYIYIKDQTVFLYTYKIHCVQFFRPIFVLTSY